MRVVNGSEAAFVQQFGGRYIIGLHGHHGLGGRHYVREIDHGAGLVRGDGQRLHGYLGQEGQRAFGAYQQVSQYLERVFVGHQRPDIEACNILDGVFVTDACGQFFIGRYFFMQGLQAFYDFRMLCPEGPAGFFGGGVQHGAIGQYHAGAKEHLVGIGVGSAAHAGGVVGYDTAHHATADGCRIRAEMPAEGRQMLIYLGSHNAGLQGYRGVFMIFPLLPVFAGHQQDAVGNGLPGKGGACCAEGYGKAQTGG